MAVDEFITYDNIKYTKKGWITRYRMLMGGADTLFSLPLRNGSGFRMFVRPGSQRGF